MQESTIEVDVLKYVLLFWAICLTAKEPDLIYLTWVDDPTTTMTVVWQGGDGAHVAFCGEEGRWEVKAAQRHPVAETEVDVYVAHIKELKGGHQYTFKIEGSEREYGFKTLPSELAGQEEVVFAVGGDMFYPGESELFEAMNRVVRKERPAFLVLGGDLAYTGGRRKKWRGRLEEMARWQQFLKLLQGEERELIPILPVVGNHDVHQHPHGAPELFYEIFPFPEKGKAYRAVEVGSYLSLVLLDTGHTWPIVGEQTEWLRGVLNKAKGAYLFAAYHVGAYPSVYKYRGEAAHIIRNAWVPLFEKAHVQAAFEHHNHAFKRTIPIGGVVYLGDGSWGVKPRAVHTPQELPYLEKSASINACWFVRLTQEKAVVEARGLKGDVVDQLVLRPR